MIGRAFSGPCMPTFRIGGSALGTGRVLPSAALGFRVAGDNKRREGGLLTLAGYHR